MASSELLQQIQAGKALKKAVTVDKSKPVIDSVKSSIGGSGSSGGGGSRINGASSAVGGTGPPQLGGLFAGGMPKLRPAGSGPPPKPGNLAKPPSIPKKFGSVPVAALQPQLAAEPAPTPEPTSRLPAAPLRSAPTPGTRVPPPPPSVPSPASRLPPRAPPPSVASPVAQEAPQPPTLPSRGAPPPPPSVFPAPRKVPPSLPSRGPPPPKPISVDFVPPLRPASTGPPSLPSRKGPPEIPSRPNGLRAVPPPPPPRPTSTLITRASIDSEDPQPTPVRGAPPPPIRPRAVSSFAPSFARPSPPAPPSRPNIPPPRQPSPPRVPSPPTASAPPAPPRPVTDTLAIRQRAISSYGSPSHAPPPPPPASRVRAPIPPQASAPSPNPRPAQPGATSIAAAIANRQSLAVPGPTPNRVHNPSSFGSSSPTPPARRAASVGNASEIRTPPRGKIPEPAAISGTLTFPTSDMFPPPRPFVKGARVYVSGGQRGSNFDIGQL